jgi:lipoate-protein ligase A
VPVGDPRVAGGVVESYRRLSAGLLAGLRHLGAGVEADRKAKEAHGQQGPVCFEVPSDYEITVNRRKLLGSAQTRRSEVVLQHGALPLEGDLGRICDVLVFGSEEEREEARSRVRGRALTLSEALSEPISTARATGALMAGFCEALNLQLEEGELTAWERTKTAELIAEKYGTEEWNRRN